MESWAGPDREYDRHGGRLRSYSRRPVVKWIGLLIAWVAVAGLLQALHLGILIWVIMVGLIAYVVYGVRRDTPRAVRPLRRRPAAAHMADMDYDGPPEFNAPPGWPDPPPGWAPPRGWQPSPAWPPAPPGWQFWLPRRRSGSGMRTAPDRYRDPYADRDPYANRDPYADRDPYAGRDPYSERDPYADRDPYDDRWS